MIENEGCSKLTVQAFAWAMTAGDRSAMEVAVPKIKTALWDKRGENGFVIKNVLDKKSIRDLLHIPHIKA